MTRILIIEDDEDFAHILKKALEQEDDLEVVDVIGTEEGAKKRISSDANNFDCVLLDLQLPYSDGDRQSNSMAGIAILQELRHQHHFFGTVIVLTNSKSQQDGQRALAAGCDGYLCKRAKTSDVASMLLELKMAIRGDVILVSSQMRHVFLRDDISAKEAQLLDLLTQGKGWPEIANSLSYKTAKAAANIGDRIFDKLLTPEDVAKIAQEGGKKRERAIEIWQARKK